MARIRNIKPEFFRHEKLQELGPIPMLVFAGLWCQCDKAGNFEWKPKQLKLDILPFIDYDIGISLEALWKSSMIYKYSGPDGREYGHIPSFREHQRFFGSEAKASPRFPAFSIENQDLELPRNFQGNSKEAPRKTLEVGKLEVGNMEVGNMDTEKHPPIESYKDGRKRETKKTKHPFEKSEFFPFEKFKAALQEWSEEKCRYWFDRAVGYSGANGGRYLDWVLAVKNWDRKTPFVDVSRIGKTSRYIPQDAGEMQRYGMI